MDYQRLSERVKAIRTLHQDSDKQKEYDELPSFTGEDQISSVTNRKIAEKMSLLLVVYGKDGTEWSISPLGQRFVRRECPRRSWFHKHE